MRLAILGASARAAAASAVTAGYEVVAADLFADRDLTACCQATRLPSDPEAFASWLAVQQVDAWMYTGGWENHPRYIEQMASNRPLLGNSGDHVCRVKSVEQLGIFLAAADVPFPQVENTPPSETGWLFKSHATTGGLGVVDWLPGSEPTTNGFWQRKIEGQAISAAYVAAGGEAVLLGATEQLIARPWTHSQPYHYSGSVGPLVDIDNGRLAGQLQLAGRTVARESGLVGLFGIDFVLDTEGQPWVVEVNPRYTASMEVVERFTGYSMVATHVAACSRGKLPRVQQVSSHFSGKAYLFAKQDIVFRLPPHGELADIPHEGDTIEQGHPICTLLVDAREYAEVEKQLIAAAEELERHLYA